MFIQLNRMESWNNRRNSISNWSIFNGYVTATTKQKEKIYRGRIIAGGDLIAKETGGNKIIAITVPKTIYYLYFNHAKDFVITLNWNQLPLIEASSDKQPSSGNATRSSDDDKDEDDPIVIKANGYFIKRFNILWLISLLIF